MNSFMNAICKGPNYLDFKNKNIKNSKNTSNSKNANNRTNINGCFNPKPIEAKEINLNCKLNLVFFYQYKKISLIYK